MAATIGDRALERGAPVAACSLGRGNGKTFLARGVITQVGVWTHCDKINSFGQGLKVRGSRVSNTFSRTACVYVALTATAWAGSDEYQVFWTVQPKNWCQTHRSQSGTFIRYRQAGPGQELTGTWKQSAC